MFRILHISDLHRSPDDPISNAALLAALDSDFDRQRSEDPAIDGIDAIIVSGDIIQGARLGDCKYSESIAEQYEVANEFLSSMAKRFLSADKSRIIVVPGNHDVDWNTAQESMAEVPESDQQTNLLEYLGIPDTPYRFCLRTRKLYRIYDYEKYAERLHQFRVFFSRFYDGVELGIPVDPKKEFNLFELDSSRIVVAGFNSCHRNDCYNSVGDIAGDAVGSAYLAIKDSGADYLLSIAVWHHSIQGPPSATDYMDVKHVRELAGRSFQLGLHGHQHRTEVYPERIYLPSEEELLIISAGSLCVGSKELPVGEYRQYNLIELSEDYSSARVHIRQMASDRAFAPRYFLAFGGRTYGDFPLAKKAVVDKYIRRRILKAEDLLADGEYLKAAELLINDKSSEAGHGRQVLRRACELGQLSELTIQHLNPPQSISEIVLLVNTFIDEQMFVEAMSVVTDNSSRLKIPDALHQELVDRIELDSKVAK